jgi:predicted AAA+ superfamily ATPase
VNITGRIEEQRLLQDVINAPESRLIALYGRRRVGKTFLVRQYFSAEIKFEIAGLHDGDLRDQLKHVYDTVSSYGIKKADRKYPDQWMDAFGLIKSYVNTLSGKGKKVLFFDELPWFDTPRSGFLMAFEDFWNSYCSKRSDLIVIICGSAASWMLKKIIHNRGGLYNRLAERIRLRPFTLAETEQFLRSRFIKMSRADILQLYMVTGGIPYYLDRIRKGESVVQFIDRACFSETGFLRTEYRDLMQSLFDNGQYHESIVRVLAQKNIGYSRNELAKLTRLPSGGSFTTLLDELIESGFITKYHPFGTAINQAYYKLTDHYIFFYHRFILATANKSKDHWKLQYSTPRGIIWAGISFELVCFNHIYQIAKALDIRSISYRYSPWRYTDSNKGAQIDLVIDRADAILNLCEIKFSKGIFTITKSYAESLRNKIQALASHKSAKKKTVLLTFIASHGISKNEYSVELVDNVVGMDDLFMG